MLKKYAEVSENASSSGLPLMQRLSPSLGQDEQEKAKFFIVR